MNYELLERVSSDEIKKIELSLLDEFHNFCEQNNLKYTLDSGTLIGAVRHKGFIPWDDDIDVSMPYPDYLKFLDIFVSTSGNAQICTGEQYGFHYTKLCDKRTVVRRDHRKDERLFGVWIDIFPMYSIDDNDEVAKNDIRKALYWGQKSWGYLGCPHRNPLKTLYHKIFDNYMLKKCLNNVDKVLEKYPYGSTKRIRIIPLFTDILAFSFNDHFDQRIKAQFEEKMYYIPRDYDFYLNNCFGDYMVLPSEDKRICHEIEAYWRNEK